MKDPFAVIKKRLVTEKSRLMEDLKNRTSSKSLAKFKLPKYVFVVDPTANKNDIAAAVEEIYSEQGVKVLKVNTLHTSCKTKRRGKGRPGDTVAFKKAIVTLQEGDALEEKA